MNGLKDEHRGRGTTHLAYEAHEYLDSVCRIVVAELSNLAHLLPDKTFVESALTEADIVYRLGSPFGFMAQYRTMGADLQIPALDLNVEVKYLRKFPNLRNSHVALPWKQVQKDIDHLLRAIEAGKKGRFAFIIGWPSRTPWRSLAQLGTGRGENPHVDPTKLAFLPFLEYDPTSGRVDSIRIRADENKGECELYHNHHEIPLHWRRYDGEAVSLAMIW